jgi:hypothetical protein
MHRTHKALPNYRLITTEGSYRSIIGQSVIFCTSQMYLGSCIGCFLAKYNLISASVAKKKAGQWFSSQTTLWLHTSYL